MSFEELELNAEIEPLAHSAGELDNLVRAARRKLADSRIGGLSPESRLVNSYQVVLCCATAVLRCLDWRVPNSGRKHYLTIKTLRYTLGLEPGTVDYCQRLRAKRHRDDYEGTLECSEHEAREASDFASTLLVSAEEFLAERGHKLED